MKEKLTFRLHSLTEQKLNSMNLHKKLILLFIFCVMIPLVFTDGIILFSIIRREKTENLKEAESMAESVYNLVLDTIGDCDRIATSIMVNGNIDEFLSAEYKDPYDFYEQYYELQDNFYFQTLVGFDSTQVKLYTSNDTVVNGGYVGRIDAVANSDWYKSFSESGEKKYLVCSYENSGSGYEPYRRISFIEKLRFKNNPNENFIRISIDYNQSARKIMNLGHTKDIYLCDGDRILLSNDGRNNARDNFYIFDRDDEVLFEMPCAYVGNEGRIIVLKNQTDIGKYFVNNLPLFIFLIIINLVFPAFMMIKLNSSIVKRIKLLERAISTVENDELVKIDNPQGSDEIGMLMYNYNKMVDRINQLIQIVYKNRLKEQEVNIAKQKAELIALHSQINPHFMFNALESIRMHSVIKGENETADMVEKLAHMERRYVDWGSDMIGIRQEMDSVEAYLGLQKYRFGERLVYELSVDEECENVEIPKLTIVTFVENACVHGMEQKESTCYVFVRVIDRQDLVVIEVEDTGTGIDEKTCEWIKEKSKTISIEDIKNAKHVGILNALLRLKMTLLEGYEFDIESEIGVGTMISIVIPRRKND